MIKVSRHAAQRYRERFAGNVTLKEAARRIRKIFRQARFKKEMPGSARAYATHGIWFIVKNDLIITVY
jgi:20S proteasome alpha/beta subunit